MRNNHTRHLYRYEGLAFDETNVFKSNKWLLDLVGANTLRLKKERGLSYEDVGKMAGCSDTMIYQICKGKVNYCGISTLSKIALAFGFTLSDWIRPDADSFGISGK